MLSRNRDLAENKEQRTKGDLTTNLFLPLWGEFRQINVTPMSIGYAIVPKYGSASGSDLPKIDALTNELSGPTEAAEPGYYIRSGETQQTAP